jgi:2'-5' RNA ligase
MSQGAGGTLRLFIGLPLDTAAAAAAGQAAAACRRQAPQLKWVDPALYHLTLRFLGETPAVRLEALVGGLAGAAVGTAPFALRLGGLTALPRGRAARVLALALVEGVAPLTALAAACEQASRALGYPVETRPFRAHLTLARSRQGETLPASLSAPLPPPAPPQPAWRAEAIQIVESILGPRGPAYRVRATLPLGGHEAVS